MNRFSSQIKKIEESGLFDKGWYLRQYPDVEILGIDPILHYLQYGAALGRKPNNTFDNNLYLQNNPDVALLNVNPFLHFILYKNKNNVSLGSELTKSENNDKQNTIVLEKRQQEKIPIVKQLSRLRKDLGAEYIRKVIMDEAQYLSKNNDVKKAGVDPIDHYFMNGEKEGREFFWNKTLATTTGFNNNFNRICYLSGYPLTDGSFKYRCLYPHEFEKNSLCYAGNENLLKYIFAIFNSKKIIFSRPEDNNKSNYLISVAKRIGVEVVLDYDDLILPEFSHMLGHVRSRVSDLQSAHKNAIRKSTMLLNADAFICSTPLLKEKLEALGKPVEIRRNKLPSRLFSTEENVRNKYKNWQNRRLKFIYLSGTATHKRDYSIINGVLHKILQEQPGSFSLTFLGSTGINSRSFEILGGDIKIVPRVSFDEMLNIIEKHDIALVPLEKTEFNDSKSNIKYIECSSKGVPIIASNVSEFAFAIRNGENGFLCDSQIEWLETIRAIINKEYDLEKIGINAYKQTFFNYRLSRN